jgi:hypothetical protein
MRVTHFLINGPQYKNKLWAFRDYTPSSLEIDSNGAISSERAIEIIKKWNTSSLYTYSLPGEHFVENTLDFS